MNDLEPVFLRMLVASLLATAGLAIGYLFVAELERDGATVVRIDRR